MPEHGVITALKREFGAVEVQDPPKKPTKVQQYEGVIREVLKQHESSRDDDQLCWWFVLVKMGADPTHMTVLDLFKGVKQGRYPNYESTARIRRKLQEDNQDLRGKLYDERHARELAVREEIVKDL
jgi:hypothetical protein